MATNLSGLSNMFEQIDTHIDAKFVFDGKEYDIEHFFISFRQGVDYKGQPQDETSGGQISIVLTQAIGFDIYDWVKRSDKQKDGKILFQSQTQGTVLEVAFFNAYCTKLIKTVDAFSGTKTNITISSGKITLNGITYDKRWRE